MGRDERTERWINNEVLGDDGVSSITDSETGTNHDVGDDLAARFGDLVETQSPSGASEADFTSGFTRATHVFVLENVIPATDSVNLYLLTSSDGGSTFDTGASDYGWALDFTNNSVSDSGGAASTGDSKLPVTSRSTGSAPDEPGLSGTVTVYGTGSSTEHTMATGEITHVNNDGILELVTVAGRRLETAAVDAVRLTFSSGNIESGTIRHFGYQ